MKIYIAGPYSAADDRGRITNVNAAIDIALDLLERGHFPLIPHLTHFVDLRARDIGRPLEWADYIAWDLQWLASCDGLLMLANSPGAQIEKEVALLLEKPVFTSVGEIPAEGPSPEKESLRWALASLQISNTNSLSEVARKAVDLLKLPLPGSGNRQNRLPT